MDKGEGWAVYGEWYGEERRVFQPKASYGELHPLQAIRACNDWIASDEAAEVVADENEVEELCIESDWSDSLVWEHAPC